MPELRRYRHRTLNNGKVSRYTNSRRTLCTTSNPAPPCPALIRRGRLEKCRVRFLHERFFRRLGFDATRETISNSKRLKRKRRILNGGKISRERRIQAIPNFNTRSKISREIRSTFSSQKSGMTQKTCQNGAIFFSPEFDAQKTPSKMGFFVVACLAGLGAFRSARLSPRQDATGRRPLHKALRLVALYMRSSFQVLFRLRGLLL